jgi:hypothetical protein
LLQMDLWSSIKPATLQMHSTCATPWLHMIVVCPEPAAELLFSSSYLLPSHAVNELLGDSLDAA